MSATEIIELIRPLTAQEKRELIGQIWEKFGDELGFVDPDLTAEQAAELDRRLAEFEKNPHDGIPLEQVEAEMRERFGWK
ncbi:MAG: addiction module protein [Verrucomicrobiales bacterium]|nr:addiction module protein [Verrucomicrobiales bacterium]